MMQIDASTTLQAFCDEVQRLERLVAERDAQIKLLLRQGHTGDEMCRRFGLRKLEFRALSYLVSRTPCTATRHEMMRALYPERDDASDYNVVSVVITRLRKALVPRGVTIKNVPGIGYRIDEQDLARLRQAGWGMPE